MSSRAAAQTASGPVQAQARRTLLGACLSHALHDGLTDAIYILLPVWQGEFGLGFGALAVLRALWSGMLAAWQIPAGRVAERFGSRLVLLGGTLMSAAGYGLAGLSGGLVGLSAALAIGGIGSATQHPLASAAISSAFGAGSRGPLGTYNFAGDVGKAVIPACLGLLLAMLTWHAALWLIAGVAVVIAFVANALLPDFAAAGDRAARTPRPGPVEGAGFRLLLAIGVLDSSVRMGFLTFLPFLLQAKGAALTMTGFALTSVFIGGGVGKFACGWLGARLGVLRTTLLTEIGTAAAIIAVIALPLVPAMVLLAPLGILLNGTSSVLYGTVPEFARPGTEAKAFAIFYTGTIGSGALSPVLYGVIGDAAGTEWGAAAAALAALLTCPFALLLARQLPRAGSTAAAASGQP